MPYTKGNVLKFFAKVGKAIGFQIAIVKNPLFIFSEETDSVTNLHRLKQY